MEDVSLTALTTTLAGNITLADSGVLTITGDVLANKAVLGIDTSAGGGGNVSITGKLDSTGGARDIDIATGAGLTTIGGNIGTVSALKSLDINASAGAGGVTISGDVGVGRVSNTTPGVTTTVNLGNSNTTGVITLSGEDFNTGGAIAFTGASLSLIHI